MFLSFETQKMERFLVYFWYPAVLLELLAADSRNSRFERSNSRLSANKFPFPLLRELACKRLIGRSVLGGVSSRNRENRKNSRLRGNNREFSPAADG
jgi:hypothetical protein